jgi:hypothetical protein
MLHVTRIKKRQMLIKLLFVNIMRKIISKTLGRWQMDICEKFCEDVNNIHQAQDRVQRKVFVTKTMNV